MDDKGLANGLVALLIGAQVLVIFATSATIRSGAFLMALITVMAMGTFFHRKLRDHLIRSAGKALSGDPSSDVFDADAAFERAMRKRSSTSAGQE